jgi:hypothetical protein
MVHEDTCDFAQKYATVYGQMDGCDMVFVVERGD